MQNLKNLGLTELLDLLIDLTTRYLQSRIYGGSEEQLERCQWLIKKVQREIELRKSVVKGQLRASLHQDGDSRYPSKKWE